MLNQIECLGHSSIKIINENQYIYIDPYDINPKNQKADIIFITHNHYDHYSEDDIMKIKKENTVIVVTSDLTNAVKKLGFDEKNIITVIPNEQYKINDINIKTIPAYNTNKKFHPKSNKWVEYILNINNCNYYISGDTDITEENKKVKCDIAFVPVGGIYTMTAKEAAELINIIKPKIAIPIHYGKIVGSKKDADEFVNLLNAEIDGKILIKNSK